MKKLEIHNSDLIKEKAKEYLDKDAEVRFMQRVQIIQFLAEHKDQSCIDAGRLFSVSPKAILKWIKRINESGDLESLRERVGRGRKSVLNEQQLLKIEKVIQQRPPKFGIKAEQWNGASLGEYINKTFGIELQIRQCQRMLQKFGAANPSGRPAN